MNKIPNHIGLASGIDMYNNLIITISEYINLLHNILLVKSDMGLLR
jgi:hypothetical protein